MPDAPPRESIIVNMSFNLVQELVLPEVTLEYLNLLVRAPGMIT